MKKIKFATNCLIVLVMFYVAYNSYFGWNKLPQSELEKIFDNIFKKGIEIAVVIYFMPVIKIYEKWVKKHEESTNE